jgi:heme/copper-type cytochrome/quinol oxidase subunit 4
VRFLTLSWACTVWSYICEFSLGNTTSKLALLEVKLGAVGAVVHLGWFILMGDKWDSIQENLVTIFIRFIDLNLVGGRLCERNLNLLDIYLRRW